MEAYEFVARWKKPETQIQLLHLLVELLEQPSPTKSTQFSELSRTPWHIPSSMLFEIIDDPSYWVEQFQRLIASLQPNENEREIL